MFTDEQAEALRKLIEQMNNDTNSARLTYIVDSMIELSRECYPERIHVLSKAS